MKEFDFDHPVFLTHSKQTRALLRAAYRSGMTEDVFVQRFKQIPALNDRSTINARNYYRHLQKKYRFFSAG